MIKGRKCGRLGFLCQRVSDQVQVLLGNFGRGLFDHLNEPIDFIGLSREADVVPIAAFGRGTLGIDNERTFCIEKCGIWQACGTAEISQQRIGPGVFERFVVFVFLNDQFDRDEILFEHGLYILPVEKCVEPFAPTAPGSAKVQEDRFLFSGCFGRSIGQNLFSGRRCGKCGLGQKTKGRDEEGDGFHKLHLLPPSEYVKGVGYGGV